MSIASDTSFIEGIFDLILTEGYKLGVWLMSEIPKSVQSDLTNGKLYKFSDWPNEDLPNVAIGMYTIWKGDLFAYVGISGTAIKEEDYEKNIIKGLKQRLNAHVLGIGGYKFCVFVFLWFVSK